MVGCGVLRGIGQTRPAALANLLGFYVLALPLAWYLAFGRGWGRLPAGRGQWMVTPPSTKIVWPVTIPAAGLSR